MESYNGIDFQFYGFKSQLEPQVIGIFAVWCDGHYHRLGRGLHRTVELGLTDSVSCPCPKELYKAHVTLNRYLSEELIMKPTECSTSTRAKSCNKAYCESLSSGAKESDRPRCLE